MKNNSNINTYINSTLKDENLEEILVDYTEIALDSILSEDILKDIPIIGTLVKSAKIIAGIQDKIFITKLYSFLTRIADIPSEERIKMIEKIDSSSEYNLKVGSKLIVLLDKLDDIEKAEVLGNLFKSFLKSKIDYSVFLRLATILNKVFLPDLIKLKNGTHLSNESKNHLYSVGLMDVKINSKSLFRDSDLVYNTTFNLNSLSRKLKEFGFND